MTKTQSVSAVQILMAETISSFKSAFIDASRAMFLDAEGNLIHAGEFGTYREAAAKQFIRAFVPRRLEIDSGFVISSDGRTSSQCDLIIYDASVAPLLQNENQQRFFPIEAVTAVGEIKSVLSSRGLHQALRKLAAVKSMREALREPSYVHNLKTGKDAREFRPAKDELDQIVTFLICERFDFAIDQQRLAKIANCYKEEAPHWPASLRHNLALSLSDGLLTYALPNDVTGSSENHPTAYPFPIRDMQSHEKNGIRRVENCFVSPGVTSPEHIALFASLLHTAVSAASSFFPDMSNYVKPQSDSVIVRFEAAL